MADGTKIEWADATLNYVNGCSLASPGCTNCYAMKQAHRFDVRRGLTVRTKGGMVWTGEVRENPKALEQALRWKRGRAIFWNAHGDVFHPNVPRSWIRKQFAAALLTPQHRHMILTKRSDRMRVELSDPDFRADVLDAASHLARDWKENARGVWHAEEWPLPNVWVGVSVEDQARADERREAFRATPAAVKFVSYEPALEPVDWTGWEFVDQIISGGESGPRARPADGDCHRDTREFCATHGIAYFFKQHGEWIDVRDLRRLAGGEGPGFGAYDHCLYDTRTETVRVGKKAAGRLLDGVEHNGVPA